MSAVICPTCKSKLTLLDLARLAGVSPASVRRYAHEPLALRTGTRRRIERAAATVIRTAAYMDEMARMAKLWAAEEREAAAYARQWIEWGRIQGGPDPTRPAAATRRRVVRDPRTGVAYTTTETTSTTDGEVPQP